MACFTEFELWNIVISALGIFASLTVAIVAIVISVKTLKQTEKQMKYQGNIDLFVLRSERWTAFCEIFYLYKNLLKGLIDKNMEEDNKKWFDDWYNKYMELRPQLSASYGLFDDDTLKYMKNISDAMLNKVVNATDILMMPSRLPAEYNLEDEINRFEIIEQEVRGRFFKLF